MYENYRMPGEFEKRSNVYVTWLPDYIRAEGFDNRQPCVDVIKALLEYGDVTVNLNCGTPGSYEEACSRLKDIFGYRNRKFVQDTCFRQS